MVQTTGTKKDFSTRLSPETLRQLDALVRSRKYKNRTAAIEAAVGRLFKDSGDDLARKREALERAAGALGGGAGLDRERWQAAEFERMEWEADRAMGRLSRR
jgi:Arc/MetJ-type ribon-helix-helix transcriptional regulator